MSPLTELGQSELAPQARILVVDDNQDAARTTALLLRFWGYGVDVAFSGPSALESARLSWPRIVLLDITMPFMSGNEVAKRLRATAHGRRLQLWALTALNGPDDVRQMLNAGFDKHLVKPIDTRRLHQLVATEIGDSLDLIDPSTNSR